MSDKKVLTEAEIETFLKPTRHGLHRWTQLVVMQ